MSFGIIGNICVNTSIWCIRQILDFEVKQGKEFSTSVLAMEIGLCNAFFEKDSRNFHAWNYRLMVFKMIYEFFPGSFWDFVDKELPFTIGMISKSFSNFSAWHYRSKLIPLYFEHKSISWNTKEAFDYFKKDLDFITNAIYTDPKDQSPWNYHHWMINNLIPLYVSKIESDDSQLTITFSDIVNAKDLIRLSDFNTAEVLNTEDYITSSSEYSETVTIKLNGRDLAIDPVISNHLTTDSSVLKLSNNVCFTKHNLHFPYIRVNKGEVSVQENFLQPYQVEFLKSQVEIINTLIKESSGFLEYAHYRKAQIVYLLEKFGVDDPKIYQTQVKEQYDILKSNSKRMKSVYEEFLKLKID
jgi:hypothetical protein